MNEIELFSELYSNRYGFDPGVGKDDYHAKKHPGALPFFLLGIKHGDRAKDEAIEALTAELEEAQKQVEWWCNLVQRRAIGTEETPSLAAYVTSLEAERDRLQAIVDKLPKTADGVAIVNQSQLYHPKYGEAVVQHIPGNPESAWCMTSQGKVSGTRCYSTREAAEAARQSD